MMKKKLEELQKPKEDSKYYPVEDKVEEKKPEEMKPEEKKPEEKKEEGAFAIDDDESDDSN